MAEGFRLLPEVAREAILRGGFLRLLAERVKDAEREAPNLWPMALAIYLAFAVALAVTLAL